MSRLQPQSEPLVQGEELLVVADGGRLADFLKHRFPGWKITTSETYLSGIAALKDRTTRAVLAFVDPADQRIHEAVAGLREAAGQETRLLLCCEPDAEPVASGAVQAGADDYLVYPLEPDELDQALGYSRPQQWASARRSGLPSASMGELDALGRIVASLEGEPKFVLRQIADWLVLATGADSLSIAIEGTVIHSGSAPKEAALVERIETEDGRVLGQITLGPKADGGYTKSECDKLRHCAAVVANLIQAALRHRKWRDLAMTDELSGLPNRRYLLQFLDKALKRAEKDRSRVTLLIFDIDNFKTYNDHCGHDAGDEIIRLAGNLFRKHCREHDIVTRYGGDEFAVVFWDAEGPRMAESDHPHDAFAVLARFTKDLSSIEHASLKSLPDVQLTISGGLATYPWDAATRDELIRRADTALLQAKHAGKNCVLTIGQVDLEASCQDSQAKTE